MNVYKYISFEQFISMVELKRLYLTQISNWEDVYEGYAFKKIFKKIFNESMECLDFIDPKSRGVKINKIVTLLFSNMYGQSWSYDDNESDAMWRIYSKNGMGVRIKFNVEENLAAIKASINNGDSRIDSFKVVYANNFDESVLENEDFIKLKRTAFSHEKEYRFIANMLSVNTIDEDIFEIMDTNDKQPIQEYSNKIIYYSISLENIKEVLLDPRAPKYHKETFEAYCKHKGFEDDNYRQSRLYTINL